MNRKLKVLLLSVLFSLTFITLSALLNSVSALIISPPNFDFSMAPGSSHEGEFMVFFGEDFPDKLYLYIKPLDFVGENADLVYVDEKLNTNTLANWITLDKYEIDKPAVLFQQNEDHIVYVKFKINIPTDASVGAHYAGIILSAKGPEVGEDQSAVSLSKEEILQFYLNVEGDYILDAKLNSFDTINSQRIFTTLPVTFETRFLNNGNIYITPSGNIEILQGDIKIHNVNLNPLGSRVFAGKERLFTNYWLSGTEIDKLSRDDIEANLQNQPKNFFEKVLHQITNFRIGIYRAELAGYIGAQPPYQSEVTFYVIPIELIITVVVIIFLSVMIIRIRARKTPKKNLTSEKKQNSYFEMK